MDSEQTTKKGSSKKTLLGIIALIVIVGGAYLAYSKGLISMGGGNKAVAVVNGEEIKERELNVRYKQLEPQYTAQGINLEDAEVQTTIRQNIVQEIVNEVLIAQHAVSNGVTVTDEEIQTRYEQIMATYENEGAFADELKKHALSESDVRMGLRRDLTIQKYIEAFAVEQNITATDAEIQELYNTLAEGKTDVPALADVRDQVEGEVMRQKIEQKIVGLLDELKGSASIQILI